MCRFFGGHNPLRVQFCVRNAFYYKCEDCDIQLSPTYSDEEAMKWR